MLETTKQKENKFLIILFCLYIIFNYICQETLLPTWISSVALYAFILSSFLSLFFGSKLNITDYSLWYFGLILISILSMLYANQAVFTTLYNMFVSLIITFCIMIAIKDINDLVFCFKAFTVAGTLMIVLMLITGQLFIETGERLGEEITGNANSFSALFMASSMFTAWLIIYRRKRKTLLLYLLTFVMQIYVMALSGGRKTLLAVLICVILFLLLKKKRDTSNLLKTIIILSGLVLVFYLFMSVPVLYDAIGSRLEGLFEIFSGEESSVSGDQIRVDMIIGAIKKWTESPFLGYGLDTFKYYNVHLTGHFYYAHNNLAELLYDLGLVGTVVYYSFYIYLFTKLIKIKTINTEYRAFGIGVLVALIIYDMGGISYYSVFPQLWLCLVYIIVHQAKKTGKANGEV